MTPYAVISGMGLICALGSDRDAVMAAIESGHQGLRPPQSMDLSDLGNPLVGEAIGWDGQGPQANRDRAVQLAYGAFRQAVTDAGVDLSHYDPYRVGIVVGTCNANALSMEALFESDNWDAALYGDQVMRHFYAADFLNDDWGIKGPKMVFVTACAASNHAMGYARDMIVQDEADVVIVLGVDSLSKATFAGFHALQALNMTGGVPFGQDYGISLGEGAAAMIVERESDCMARKGRIHAYIGGYGFNSDAYHATSPDKTGKGAAATMAGALAMAGISPEQVSVICAHGTGTEANDAAESLAIARCFGEHAYHGLSVTSTKSLYGHTLGASGMTQSVIMIDSMARGWIPPIQGFKARRPGCDLDYVSNSLRIQSVDTIMSNSFAFGGNNVSVVLCKNRPPTNGGVTSAEPIVISQWSALTPHIQDLRDWVAIHDQHEDPLPRIRRFEGFRIRNPRLRKFNKAPLMTRLAIESVDRMMTAFPAQSWHDWGLIVGTARGPMKTFESFYQAIVSDGMAYGSAVDFQHIVMNAMAGQIAIANGFTGCNTTIAGNAFLAVKHAIEWLQHAQEPAILVSSADALANRDCQLLPQTQYGDIAWCDGAATLLLERESAAIRANRPPLGYVDSMVAASFPVGSMGLAEQMHCMQQSIAMGASAIDVHVHASLGCEVPVIEGLARVSSQPYVGTLESTTPLINVIYALILMDPDAEWLRRFHGIAHIPQVILMSYATISGQCCSFILRRGVTL